MKTKIVKNYLYEGLGFPVALHAVEMRLIDGEWCPIIDVQKVADEVIQKLAVQETRLTGNQIKFIRSYYAMPLREFGEKVVHESHMAVCKWEKMAELPTNMNANTEHELRLYIIEKAHLQAKGAKSKFYDIYLATKRFFGGSSGKAALIHASA